MVKAILMLVLLLALTSAVYGAGNFSQVTHYQYVTEWTPTYCRYPPLGSVCLSGLPDIFVMHGIWPADSAGFPVKPCQTVSLSNDLVINIYTHNAQRSISLYESLCIYAINDSTIFLCR